MIQDVDQDDAYYCCLDPSGPRCTDFNTPSNIDDAKCKNMWTRKCSKSNEMTTGPCLTFISNITRNNMADMDGPVRAFCAMHREIDKPHYELCKCVNFDNTCEGQKIMKVMAGSPGCYFPSCKSPDTLKTSDLMQPECRNVTCTMKDITVSGGDLQLNQNCESGAPKTQADADEPWSPYEYTAHSNSNCTGSRIESYDKTFVDLDTDTIISTCKQACNDRESCKAFSINSEGDQRDKKSRCVLYSNNGVKAGNKGESCYDTKHVPA